MEKLDSAALRELMDRTNGLFVSIYMPAHPAGQETRQDPIRFRNLLKQAEERLLQDGVRRTDIQEMLKPARNLLDNSDFWQNQGYGLTVIIGHDYFQTYSVPREFEELVVVADRPYIKPLLPLFTEDGSFFVLALSQHDVRLLSCSRHTAQEMKLPAELPRNIDELMRYYDQEQHLQWHTETQPGQPTGSERKAMFHGQGVGTDDAVHKKNVQDFLRLVARHVDKKLAGRRWPLVLAGTDWIRAAFREASGYHNILPDGVPGNPERWSPEQLRDLAWPVVEPLIRDAMDNAIGNWERARSTSMGSANLDEIVPAAYHGRIYQLFVTVRDHQWGRYDPMTNSVELHRERQPGDQDLLDFIAVHAMQHGGLVFALDADRLNTTECALAVFRVPGVYTRATRAEVARRSD